MPGRGGVESDAIRGVSGEDTRTGEYRMREETERMLQEVLTVELGTNGPHIAR